MIGYLEGTILHFEPDGILLLAGNVGYEVQLNPLLLDEVKTKGAENELLPLYIYYHQTERQPKPVLIGFKTLEDKQFFQAFITVDAIGPMKALKAMSRPVPEIARAIENKEVSFLSGLSGIGKRTAEKIIAALHGKVDKYTAGRQILADTPDIPESENKSEIIMVVTEVLVNQLGHSQQSARRMIQEAFDRNIDISTPEALFDEIYQESR